MITAVQIVKDFNQFRFSGTTAAGELPVPIDAATERPFPIGCNFSLLQISIHQCLGRMVRRHLVELAALFMQPEPVAPGRVHGLPGVEG